MLKKISLGLFASAVLALAAVAQNCSTLTASTVDHGSVQALTFDLTGSFPRAPQILVVGRSAGTTTITLPGATLTFGLARPFLPMGLGFSSGAGSLSRTFAVPTGLGTIFAQDLGVRLGRRPHEFCMSNVVSITL